MTKFLKNISVESEGHIQFKTIDGTNAGKIDQDGNDLVLTNAVGDILLGDGDADIYIGDGSNNVDILFEQSGNIKADDSASNVTLTLGSSNTSLNIINPTINGNINSSNTFDFNQGGDFNGPINSSGTNRAIQVNGTTRINSVGDIIGTSYYVGSQAVIDTNRNLTVGTINSGAITSTGNIKAQGGGNIYVYDDDDDTRVHIDASSNSTEGVFRVSNGANYGLIVRGISNNPRLGAYHNGTLDIYGFGNSDGADHASDDQLARFDFANEKFLVNGEIEGASLDINGNADISGNLVIAGTVDGVDISALPTTFAPTNAEQNVQSDWNATSGDALILNKPSIPAAITDYVSAANGGTFGGAITVTGELEATSLDINGRVDLQTISTSVDGTVIRGGFLNPAAEASMVHIPHLINDLAGFQKWSNSTITVTGLYKTRSGSSGSYTYSNAVTESDFSGGQAFDAHSSTAGSWYSNNGADGSTAGVGVITLEWPNELQYSAWAGIVFGSGSFSAPRVKIEAYRGGAWQTLCNITDNNQNVVLRQIASNSGTNNATTKLRYTLGGSVNGSYFRIHTLYAANYRAGDNNLNNTSTAHTQGVNFLEKYKDGYLHGNLYPGADDTYDLGSNSYQWRNGYFDGSVICDGVTVDGNIAVNGTVDGVDIAALAIANTGDQDLSGYLLNTTDTLTGRLTVTSSVRVGNDTAAATSANTGALRYYETGGVSYVDMCMKTDNSTWAWVNITRNIFSV